MPSVRLHTEDIAIVFEYSDEHGASGEIIERTGDLREQHRLTVAMIDAWTGRVYVPFGQPAPSNVWFLLHVLDRLYGDALVVEGLPQLPEAQSEELDGVRVEPEF